MRLTGVVFHPLLLMAFPPLFLLANNVREFGPGVLLRPLGVGLVAVAASMAGLWLLYRDWHRTGILVSLAVLLFYSQGHLWRLLVVHDLQPTNPWVSSQTVVFAISLLGYVLAAVRLWRVRVDLSPLTRVLNVFGVCVITLPVWTIVRHEVTQGAVLRSMSNPPPPVQGSTAQAIPGQGRHIFYIIVDGYSRSDNLKEIYGFDNTPFLSYLRGRGFFVADHSRSNYAFTQVSIPSALYMDYLPQGILPRKIPNRFRVSDFLSQRGYKFVSLATGYAPTEYKDADLYLQPASHQGEFERGLFDYLPVVGSADPAATDRERIRFAFAQLPKLAASGAPLFVFAHIVCPHPPYVFAEDGRPSDMKVYFGTAQAGLLLGPGGISRSESMRRYVSQVEFVNGALQTAVDGILRAAKEPPIIVIQSDHGHLDFFDVKRAPDNSYLQDRFSILNAYHLPEGGDRCVFDGITPVNSFRAIFDCYFGTHLGRLPDRSFVSRENDIHNYLDVTGLIDSEDDRRHYAELRAREGFE